MASENELYRLAENGVCNKERPIHIVYGSFLVRPGGFEPLAFRVGAERSIQLSYDRICMKNVVLTYFNLVK